MTIGVLFVCSVFILIGAVFLLRQKRESVPSSGMNLQMPPGFVSFGIDVSHYNGLIDWERMIHLQPKGKEIQFVYCKATEGVGMVDKTWQRNRKILKKVGIPFGAYHFFSDKSDPASQAAHFLRNWHPEMGDLPPVLDVENMQLPRGELIHRMDIWLSIVEKESGVQPIIYVSLNDYKVLFYDVFKGYKFWIAAYSRVPESLQDERVIHWQFSERGELEGVQHKTDFNYSKLRFGK